MLVVTSEDSVVSNYAEVHSESNSDVVILCLAYAGITIQNGVKNYTEVQ